MIADYATTVAALVAACGLLLTWRALAAQSRAADLDNLLALTSFAREAEARIFSASTPEDRKQEVTNYLNLVEVYAAAVNRKLLRGVSVRITRDRLINDLGILGASEEVHGYLDTAITSPETFLEIQRFCRVNKEKIRAATTRQMLRANSAEE